MYSQLWRLCVGLCAAALFLHGAAFARAADMDIKPIAEWGNDEFIIEDLKLLAPMDEHIVDEAQWTKLWTAWRGEKTKTPPKVNFEEQLVLVVTSRSSKGGVRARLNDKGNLIVVLEDQIAEAVQKKAGGGWYYAFAVIPREGIKMINGKPVRAVGSVSAKPAEDALKSITERLKKLEQANAELTATVDRLQKELEQLKKK